MSLLFWRTKPVPIIPISPYAVIFQAFADYGGDKKALLELLLKAYLPAYHLQQYPKHKKIDPSMQLTDEEIKKTYKAICER